MQQQAEQQLQGLGQEEALGWGAEEAGSGCCWAAALQLQLQTGSAGCSATALLLRCWSRAGPEAGSQLLLLLRRRRRIEAKRAQLQHEVAAAAAGAAAGPALLQLCWRRRRRRSCCPPPAPPATPSALWPHALPAAAEAVQLPLPPELPPQHQRCCPALLERQPEARLRLCLRTWASCPCWPLPAPLPPPSAQPAPQEVLLC